MKIIATIADARTPKGWEECYTSTRHDASAVDCRNQAERIVRKFNNTLRPQRGEIPRELRSLRTEEMQPADAFQMGIRASEDGLMESDNYWPAEHPLHDEWLRGWQMADDRDDVELPEEEAV